MTAFAFSRDPSGLKELVGTLLVEGGGACLDAQAGVSGGWSWLWVWSGVGMWSNPELVYLRSENSKGT